MAKTSNRSLARKEQVPSPAAPSAPAEGWMGDVEFTPADLASCKKFCHEVEVFLRKEEVRLSKRLGVPAGRDAVVAAGRHQG
jgi:hypothetical protein